MYGAGDAVIGINPVTDDPGTTAKILNATGDFMRQWRIPTQNCCLAHVTTQMKALEQGAQLGLMFQSIAGTEKALRSFGVTLPLLDEALDMTLKLGQAQGPNVMYFETGQGSALSADAHEGADQMTLEARNYGLARHYHPFLVNTVVGFIGPEYLYDARQITRAGLEDHFMGKLHGISMGCDACYTNHADADQNDLENLEVLLTTAGCNFFMGLPMGDDVMLNYQSTSFHDGAALRQLFGFRPAPEFEAWLEEMGIMRDGKLTPRAGDPTSAVVMKPTPPTIDRARIEAMVREALEPRSRRRRGGRARARDRHGGRAAADARSRRQRRRALRSAGDGAHPGGDAGSRRGRPGRAALPHQHDAPLPRRSRRREGRGAVGGRSGAARAPRDVRGRVAGARQGDVPAAARSGPDAVRGGPRRADQAHRPRADAGRSSTATACPPPR